MIPETEFILSIILAYLSQTGHPNNYQQLMLDLSITINQVECETLWNLIDQLKEPLKLVSQSDEQTAKFTLDPAKAFSIIFNPKLGLNNNSTNSRLFKQRITAASPSLNAKIPFVRDDSIERAKANYNRSPDNTRTQNHYNSLLQTKNVREKLKKINEQVSQIQTKEEMRKLIYIELTALFSNYNLPIQYENNVLIISRTRVREILRNNNDQFQNSIFEYLDSLYFLTLKEDHDIKN